MFNVTDYSNKDVVLIKTGFLAQYGLSTRATTLPGEIKLSSI